MSRLEINFEQNRSLKADEIKLTVQAAELSPEVVALMQHLTQAQAPRTVLPLTVEDRVAMVPIAEIIAIEVYGSELTIYTVQTTYQVRGILKKIVTQIGSPDFIQVAKGTVLNINHLQSLEAAFSGSMTAFLTNQVKVSVSRKYLPKLKQQLGL